MALTFDISQDEMPIFLAEVDEHLQGLDDLLILMERLDNGDAEELQKAFRAAHTLKGMSGMIGHTRMVNVTHALETAFDGIRKGTVQITEGLIDVCLDAVDSLRLLRDEVVTGEECDFQIEDLVDRIHFCIRDSDGTPENAYQPAAAETKTRVVSDQNVTLGGVEEPPPPATEGTAEGNLLSVYARISPDSIASAARAFQLMLGLQELGVIHEMHPSQAEIEKSAPVHEFCAVLQSERTAEEVRKSLLFISEVDQVAVEPFKPGEKVRLPEPPPAEKPADTEPGDKEAAPANGRSQGKAETEPAAKPARRGAEAKVDMTVRTSVERLDTLMSLVGELITDRNHLYQVRNKLQGEHHGDPKVEQLNETVAHLSRITDQLQEEVMRIRMMPIGNVFHKFPRLVRDLAQKTGKKIELVISGEDTELDRSVIDEINDPLIHILRNSVDHGIELPRDRLAAGKPEVGKIYLTARHEQGRILITIEDDGKGIDIERLKRSAISKGILSEEDVKGLADDKALDLIFLSGLSTARNVTDLSGRGVGMDIVRTNIQRVSGNIMVDTVPGQGTQFHLILPLTLAIVPTLLVRSGDTTLAVPLVMVAETQRLTPKDISTLRGKPVTMLRDQVLPLVSVQDVFGMHHNGKQNDDSYVVVVHSGKQRAGLLVDTLLGQEEVVVKSMGRLIGDTPGISSAAILGDGSVALIIDVPGLLLLSGFLR
jgi:two-component system chemotaxis sensor kinase CheA